MLSVTSLVQDALFPAKIFVTFGWITGAVYFWLWALLRIISFKLTYFIFYFVFSRKDFAPHSFHKNIWSFKENNVLRKSLDDAHTFLTFNVTSFRRSTYETLKGVVKFGKHNGLKIRKFQVPLPLSSCFSFKNLTVPVAERLIRLSYKKSIHLWGR